MSVGGTLCGGCSRDLDDEETNAGEFMIQCDACDTWFHGRCVELEEYEAADIDRYHCPSCLSTAGPSKQKRVTNDHRHDSSEANASKKRTQNGTKRFIEALKLRKFDNALNGIVAVKDGQDLTLEYIEQTTFRSPILVENHVNLGMRVPPPDFTIDDVEKHVGGDRYVDVISVHSQQTFKMRLRVFLSYLHQQPRTKLYNLISLEFSDTEMNKLVKVPNIVEEISWVDQYWPKPLRDDLSISQKTVLNEHIAVRPEVSKFCLIGMSDSYTDFHVDFGGTSVWYHVLKGEKIFYLIEPTPANLQLFENWQQSSDCSEKFFGDIVKKCSRLVLKPGHTLFIPTGWIHAVLTPSDSLVVGGNFLHSFNIGLQIQIYEMEKRLNTSDKFMFPHFELTNWYAGMHYLDVLKELNEEKNAAKPYLLQGLKDLVTAMKQWIELNQVKLKRSKLSGQIIVETMTCVQVAKQLDKVVQINEKLVQPPRLKRKNQQPKAKPVKFAKPVDKSKSVEKSPVEEKIPLGPIKVTLPRSRAKKTEIMKRQPVVCPKSPGRSRGQAEKRTKNSNTDDQLSEIDKITAMEVASLKPTPAVTTETTTAATEPTDSVPPTPGRSDDEISSDIAETAKNPTAEIAPVEVKVDPDDENDDSEVPVPAVNPEQCNKRKTFGFSLLDIQAGSSDSASSSTDRITSSSPSTLNTSGTTRDAANIKGQSTAHSSLSQNVSSYGRVSKLNRWSAGKMSASTFIPNLGICGQDDEFVYPSLSDSDADDAPKRAKLIKSAGKSPVAEIKPKPTAPASSKPTDPKKPKLESIVPLKPQLPKKPSTAKPTKPVSSGEGNTKTKKVTTTAKQRLANKLKIRKLIPM